MMTLQKCRQWPIGDFSNGFLDIWICSSALAGYLDRWVEPVCVFAYPLFLPVFQQERPSEKVTIVEYLLD